MTRQMMKSYTTISIVFLSLAAIAAPAPPIETEAEAQTRISAALSSKKLPASANGQIMLDDDGEVVIDIKAMDGIEPVPSLIRQSHSAVVWRLKHGSTVKKWLINWSWEGQSIGIQLSRPTAFKEDLAKITSGAAISSFVYNGGSEKGLITVANWCRRGGAYQLQALCEQIKRKAVERMVWERSAFPE